MIAVDLFSHIVQEVVESFFFIQAVAGNVAVLDGLGDRLQQVAVVGGGHGGYAFGGLLNVQIKEETGVFVFAEALDVVRDLASRALFHWWR